MQRARLPRRPTAILVASLFLLGPAAVAHGGADAVQATATVVEGAGVPDAELGRIASALGWSLHDTEELVAAGGGLAASLAALRMAQAHGDPAVLEATIAKVLPAIEEAVAAMRAPAPCDAGAADGPRGGFRPGTPATLVGFVLGTLGVAGGARADEAGQAPDPSASRPDGPPPGGRGGPGLCVSGVANDHHDGGGSHRFAAGGVFIDAGGDDTYHAGDASFGASGGIFIDLGGNDTYHAGQGSFGAAGGLFIDAGGDDTYLAAGHAMGQGTGTLPGTGRGAPAPALRGTFVDLGGDDRYDSGPRSFGAAGGMFLELAGSDAYRGTGGSLGASPPASGLDGVLPASTFIDRAGDDTYSLSWDGPVSGAFGYGNALFLDGGGDDRYTVDAVPPAAVPAVFGAGGGQGTEPWWSGVGTFIDLAGDDVYDVAGSDALSFGQTIGGMFFDDDGAGERNDHGMAGGAPFFPQNHAGPADLETLPFFAADEVAVALSWDTLVPGVDVVLPDADGLVHGGLQAMEHVADWQPCGGCAFSITLFPGAVSEDGAVIPGAPGPEWSAQGTTVTVTTGADGTAPFSFNASELPLFHVVGNDVPLGNGYYVGIAGPGGETNHFAPKRLLMDLERYGEVDALDRGEDDFYQRGISHMSPVFVMHAGSGVGDAGDAGGVIATAQDLLETVDGPGCLPELHAATGNEYERGPIAIEGDAELSGAGAVWNDVCEGDDGPYIPAMLVLPGGRTIDPDQLQAPHDRLLHIQDTTTALLVAGLRTATTAGQPPLVTVQDASGITFRGVAHDQVVSLTASNGITVEDSDLGSLTSQGGEGLAIAGTTFDDAYDNTTVDIDAAGGLVALRDVDIDGDLSISGAEQVVLDGVTADRVTITGGVVDISGLTALRLVVDADDLVMDDSDLTAGAGAALDATVGSLQVTDTTLHGSGADALLAQATGDIALANLTITGDGGCMDLTGGAIALDASAATCTGGSRADGDEIQVTASGLTATGAGGPVLDASATTVRLAGTAVAGGSSGLQLAASDWSVADGAFQDTAAAIRAGGGTGSVTGTTFGDGIALEAVGTAPAVAGAVTFQDNIVPSESPFFADSGSFDAHFALELWRTPTNGTNVIGGPRLGGNHWPGAALWDGDGDGIAQQPHSPQGTAAVDARPLATPNHAPVVTSLETTPDVAAPWQAIVPGMLLNLSADASDPDDEPLAYRWTLPGGVAEGPTAQGIALPSPGVQHIELSVVDPLGATATQTVTFYVDAPNAAPVIEAVHVGPCTQEAAVLSGEPVCLRVDHHDADAGDDRTDAIVLDLDGDGSGDPDDIVLSRLDAPLPHPAGPLGEPVPVLLDSPARFAVDGDGRLLVDVDGDGTRSAGDVDLTDAPGHRLRPTDDVGGAVTAHPCAVGFEDLDDDGARGPDEPAYVDTDCDGKLSGGDIDLATLQPAAGNGTPLLPIAAHLGAWDRNGDPRVAWSISVGTDIHQASGAEASFTPTRPGPALGLLRVEDRGVPSLWAQESLSFTVASGDAPSPAVDVSPSQRVDGRFQVFRGTTVQLTDATQPPPMTQIETARWSIDGVEVGTGRSVTFAPSQDDIGTHDLLLEVTLNTGRTGSVLETIEVRPQPPRPLLEWTPAAGIQTGQLVAFTGVGSRDAGAPTTPVGQRVDILESAEVASLLVLDVDGDGTISAGDVPLDAPRLTYAPFEPPAADEGSLVPMPAWPEVCFDDLDDDGNLSAGDVVTLARDCGAFAGGDLLLVGERGARIDPLADDAVRQSPTPAPDAAIGLLGTTIHLDTDGSGNATAGDVVLSDPGGILGAPSGEPVPYDVTATLGEALSYLDRSGDGIRDAGGWYLTIGGLGLRLEGWEETTEAFVPLPAHHGLLGDASLEGAYLLCGSDTASQGAPASFDFGEPAFLSRWGCGAIGADDIRLQPGQDLATGQIAAAGTRVGEHGEEAGLPAFQAGGSFALLAGGHLAHAEGPLGHGDLRITRVDGRPPASTVLPPSSSDAPGALTYTWRCTLGCGGGAVAIDDPDDDGVLLHAFATSGVKEIQMEVTDSSGTSATETRRLTLDNQAPTARIFASPEHPTDLDLVTLDGRLSTDPDGTIAVYTWMFDDGTPPRTGPVIQKRFDEPGLYRVTLWIRDADTGAPRDAATTVLLEVSNAPPQLAYSFTPAQPRSLDSVTFDASQSRDLDGQIKSFRWRIQDGEQEFVLHGPIVTYAFQTAGQHTVRLEAEDDREAVATQDIQIHVDNLPPQAVADILVLDEDGATVRTAATSGAPPFTVQFSGSRSSDADGAIASYRWSLGGATLGNTKTLTRTFESRGVFEVVLEVTDAAGATDSSSVLVNALNRAPSPGIIGSSEVLLDEPVTFRGVATDPEGDALSFTWDIGGTPLEGEEVTHTFTTAGPQQVRLTATDDRGGSAVATKTVDVMSQPPVLSLQVSPATVARGEPVTVTGSARDEDGDGAIGSHFIDFGDDHTVFASQATHTYGEPGTYRVVYRATEANGAFASRAADVQVINPPPTITSIDVTPGSVGVGDLVLFTADVFDDRPEGLSYRWDFKDGVVSARQTPTHVYQVPATFQVELVVRDAYGAEARQVVEVQVTGLGSDSTGDSSDDQANTRDPEAIQDATRVDKDSPTAAVGTLLAALAALAARRRR